MCKSVNLTSHGITALVALLKKNNKKIQGYIKPKQINTHKTKQTNKQTQKRT